MGIKNLTKLIKTYAPNAIRQVDISTYAHQRLAIDANLFVYKFLHGPDAHPSRALYGFLELERWFKKFDIQVLFVFDGRKLEAKRPEIQRRWTKRKRLMNRVQECRHHLHELEHQEHEKEPRERDDQPSAPADRPDWRERDRQERDPAQLVLRVKSELANLEQQIVHVSPQQITDCQRLLKLAGIPVLIAEHEAEATCASLNRLGYVGGVVTEDTDSLCFGCSVMLRDCRPQKRLLTEIRLSVLLKELRIDMPQFVDLCILCGCDFSSALRSLSYLDALPAIRERGSIEAILDTMPHPENFFYQEARAIFLNPPAVGQAELDHLFDTEPPDPKALDDFLRRRVGWRKR